MGKGPRATVRRDRLPEAPHLAWNAYIDLLSSTGYDELTSIQRVAFLAFHYDSEVKSGGHTRYFRNQGADRLEETVAALGRLAAVRQQAVLERAGSMWETATDEELNRLDDEFHMSRPDVHVRLEAWLDAHIDEFVVFEG